jgi:hypothetical protein
MSLMQQYRSLSVSEAVIGYLLAVLMTVKTLWLPVYEPRPYYSSTQHQFHPSTDAAFTRQVRESLEEAGVQVRARVAHSPCMFLPQFDAFFMCNSRRYSTCKCP